MEPRPGSQVGPYRVEALIARGGMGAVFRAVRADGARVALKVLTGGARERFEREAELAARLSHPGIVRVHGAGESGGSCWIAMELVEGEPLDARCGKVSPVEAARLVAQVARAIEHAHARGVLHRDLKPSNVLVRADGAALVTDFGVARAVEGSSLTKTGALVGTPLFMAPEQAAGQPSTAATDVHGLGLLLFTLLTGASPFERDDALAVLVAVTRDRPPPPSAARPLVPEALDQLCLAALEKEPARRPAIGALAAGLEDVAARRDRRRPRRSRRGALALAVGVCVAAGAAAFARRAGPPPPDAPLPAATGSAAVATTVVASSARAPFPVGTTLRLQLTSWSDVQIATTASIGSVAFAFDVRLEEVTGDESRYAGRLVALAAQFGLPGTGAPTMEFDSARPDEATSVFQPLRRLSDAAVSIHIDHARGDALRVVGLDERCDEALAEVTESFPRPDSTTLTLLAMFKTLLQTLRNERVRELLEVLLHVGPLQPGPRWTHERSLRSGLDTKPRSVTVELRRDDPRPLRWRLRRGEEDGFEASGEWELDLEGRVAVAAYQDLSTRSGAQWARVERRYTLRVEVLR